MRSIPSGTFVNIGFFFTLLLCGTPLFCDGHEEPLHQEITRSAFKSSSGVSSFLADQLGAADVPFTSNPKISDINPSEFLSSRFGIMSESPMEWLAWGAYMEDDDAPQVGGYDTLRCANHFYAFLHTPVWLTDATETLLPQLPEPRTDSFTWATSSSFGGSTLLEKSSGPNFYTWQGARNRQFESLTFGTQASRKASLAECLYAIGHILHLNQDLSSPDHVRNDEHVPYHWAFARNGKHWFEQYGLDEYYTKSKNAGTLAQTFPTRPRGRQSWRDAGFLKLEDFWNRKKYTGNSIALNNDRFASPGTSTAGNQLGLAEFSNGNFLGEDATYRELILSGSTEYTLHYFPFPSLFTSTRFLKDNGTISLQGHLWGASTELVTFKNGMQGKRPYIKKVADGIPVNKHSVLLYNGVRHADIPDLKKMISIGDNAVLAEYHSILIPKAIEYSAGIMDYFFRGKIDGSAPVWSSASSQYTVAVKNTSGESFKGGEFTLWNDDANDNRSQVGSAFALSGVMADNAVQQITFNSPEITSPKFMLLYKGSIGLTGGNPSDPVDENIAIAAKKLGFHSSFESPLNQVFSVGDTLPEGWVVEAGNVDTVVEDLGENDSFEKKGFLDLNGTTAGTISVDLVTLPGKEYTLTFAYARNANPSTPTPAVAQFLINGVAVSPSISISAPNTWGNLGWQIFTHNFTAANASTQLRFQSLNSGDGGVLIDAVDVKPTP